MLTKHVFFGCSDNLIRFIKLVAVFNAKYAILLHLLTLPHTKPATIHQAGIFGHKEHEILDFCTSWLLDIAFAGVLVIYPCLDYRVSQGVVDLHDHALSLTSLLKLD